MSFDQARELAAAEKRPILIDFTGVNCANCRLMEAGVLPRPQVVSLLKKFVTVQLYTDFVPIWLAHGRPARRAGWRKSGSPAQAGQGSNQSHSTSFCRPTAKCWRAWQDYNEVRRSSSTS